MQVNMGRYEQLKNDNEELLKIQYVYNDILQKNGMLEMERNRLEEDLNKVIDSVSDLERENRALS